MGVEISKEVLLDAFDDICTIFDFEKEIDVKKATTEKIVKFLEEKQSTDDAFQPEDLETLQPETIAVLKKIGIILPKTKKEKKMTKKSKVKTAKTTEKTPAEKEEEPQTKAKVKVVKTVEKEEEPKAKTAKAVNEDKVEKPTAEGSKKSTRKDRNVFYEKMFSEGTTKDAVIKAILKKYPETMVSTIRTELSDSKNPKYNRLSKLVVEVDGILKFED